jgi:hypothetical protein
MMMLPTVARWAGGTLAVGLLALSPNPSANA